MSLFIIINYLTPFEKNYSLEASVFRMIDPEESAFCQQFPQFPRLVDQRLLSFG